jgi:CheY-like chemotaxis protein
MEAEQKPVHEKIFVAVDDMFFAAKILGTAQQLGRRVERLKSLAELREALEEEIPALLIIDLNSTQFQALEMVEFCKAHPALSAMPILGFLSHVQVELKRRAEQSGCDFVMPRSAFAQTLPEILSGKLPNSSAKHR